MAYAFSRDGAMPLSSLWHKVKHWLSVSVFSFVKRCNFRFLWLLKSGIIFLNISVKC